MATVPAAQHSTPPGSSGRGRRLTAMHDRSKPPIFFTDRDPQTGAPGPGDCYCVRGTETAGKYSSAAFGGGRRAG